MPPKCRYYFAGVESAIVLVHTAVATFRLPHSPLLSGLYLDQTDTSTGVRHRLGAAALMGWKVTTLLCIVGIY